MLTNYDIIEISKHMKLNLKGVFSKDSMPTSSNTGCYVINLQDQKNKNGQYNEGSHWVAIYIGIENIENKKIKKACYFDSFGCPPPISIEHFLNKFIPYTYNADQIQDINDTHCGWYCIIFLEFMTYNNKKYPDINKRYKKFLDKWDDNPKKNKLLLGYNMNKISYHL